MLPFSVKSVLSLIPSTQTVTANNSGSPAINSGFTAAEATTLWWNMMSHVGKVTQVDNRTLKLEESGKVMWLRIDTDLKIQWEIGDATPANTYESKNPGVKAIRFQARVRRGSRHTITATFSHEPPQ